VPFLRDLHWLNGFRRNLYSSEQAKQKKTKINDFRRQGENDGLGAGQSVDYGRIFGAGPTECWMRFIYQCSILRISLLFR
jgi:hypothetical protein